MSLDTEFVTNCQGKNKYYHKDFQRDEQYDNFSGF